MLSGTLFRLSGLFALLTSLVLAQEPQPGQGCTGDVAYCVAGTPIILRCTGTTLQPGNCNDNLDEPPNGALCVELSPTAGDAVCSAIGSPAPGFPSVSGSLIPLSTAASSTVVATSTSTAASTSTSTVVLTTTISVSSTVTLTSSPSITPSTTSGTPSVTTIAIISEFTDGQPQKPTNASTVVLSSPTITPFTSAAAFSAISGLAAVLIVAVGTIIAL